MEPLLESHPWFTVCAFDHPNITHFLLKSYFIMHFMRGITRQCGWGNNWRCKNKPQWAINSLHFMLCDATETSLGILNCDQSVDILSTQQCDRQQGHCFSSWRFERLSNIKISTQTAGLTLFEQDLSLCCPPPRCCSFLRICWGHPSNQRLSWGLPPRWTPASGRPPAPPVQDRCWRAWPWHGGRRSQTIAATSGFRRGENRGIIIFYRGHVFTSADTRTRHESARMSRWRFRAKDTDV